MIGITIEFKIMKAHFRAYIYIIKNLITNAIKLKRRMMGHISGRVNGTGYLKSISYRSSIFAAYASVKTVAYLQNHTFLNQFS